MGRGRSKKQVWQNDDSELDKAPLVQQVPPTFLPANFYECPSHFLPQTFFSTLNPHQHTLNQMAVQSRKTGGEGMTHTR